MLALLCGGQGRLSAHIFDLVAEQPQAGPILAEAGALLGRDPRDLVRSDDHEALLSNRTSQILSVCAALATCACLAEALPAEVAVAGNSVGEMAAWGIAGAWTAETSLRLTDRRARAMDAADGGAGGLGYVRGLARPAVEALARGHGCAIAIVNPKRLFVLGGKREDVAALCRAAEASGARAALLKVRVASHTPRLAAAVTPFQAALASSRPANPALDACFSPVDRGPASSRPRARSRTSRRRSPGRSIGPLRWRPWARPASTGSSISAPAMRSPTWRARPILKRAAMLPTPSTAWKACAPGSPPLRARRVLNHGEAPGDALVRRRRTMMIDRRSLTVAMAAAGAASLVSGRSLAAPAVVVPARNVVLVHGLFADGSSWSEVISRLQARGLNVTSVQNPLTTLPEAVAATQRVLDRQDGPTVLAGHSFSGMIVTEAGVHPKVSALVYVAARAPDAGEDYMALAKRFPAAPASAGIVFDGDEGRLSEAAFLHDFAGDLPEAKAKALYAVQWPFQKPLLAGKTTHAAWRSKRSFYAVSTDDRTINPDLERFMAKRMGAKTIEVKASHVSLISQPDAIAGLILEAAGPA